MVYCNNLKRIYTGADQANIYMAIGIHHNRIHSYAINIDTMYVNKLIARDVTEKLTPLHTSEGSA